MNNFYCKRKDHSFHLGHFRVIQRGDSIVYIDPKSQRHIRCPNCDCDNSVENISFIEREGDINVSIGMFSSKSPEQKKEILKKRADMHSKKNLERRKHLDKTFTGTLKNTDI